jgi:hypothetical protein
MTYGVFNLDSGNLIDSHRTKKRALMLVAEMLEDYDNDADEIGLVVMNKGKTVETITGDALRSAAEPYANQIPA